jgi:two-component system, response regulator PdtaR
MPAVSVIIAEDEAITAMFMEKMLKRNGFNILKCVSSGEEAVNSCTILRPQLVIMDIRLAGKMNGIEAALKINEISTGATKFIFMTGYSDNDLKEQATQVKPVHFFIKPLNLHELIRVINQYFDTNLEAPHS